MSVSNYLKILVIAFVFFTFWASLGLAQDLKNTEKLGQHALMSGNFKEAIVHLEKVLISDSLNTNVLWMLGYSYFHLKNYKKAIHTFNRLIELAPEDINCYYYKAKSESRLADEYAWNAGKVKEDLMMDAIADLNKGLKNFPGDTKLLLSRGLMYLDFGIFKGQKFEKTYSKRQSIKNLKLALADLNLVQDLEPSRKDISPHIEKANAYLTDLK